jgi:hypothetical protein
MVNKLKRSKIHQHFDREMEEYAMFLTEAETRFLKNYLPKGFTFYEEDGNCTSVRVTNKYALLSAIIVEEELRLMGYSSAMVEVEPKVDGEVEEIRFIFDLLYFTDEQFLYCLNLIARTIGCFEDMYSR